MISRTFSKRLELSLLNKRKRFWHISLYPARTADIHSRNHYRRKRVTMSEPATEMFDAVITQKEQPPKPPREMSQAAITSFFYGTLQLLFTSIASALVFALMQGMKAFESALSGPADSNEGTDTLNLADMQKMIEEMGMTDPALSPAAPNPSTVPALPVQGGSGFPFDSTPSQIVPMEFFAILLTHGFGLLGLLTAFVAFGAVSKGKTGRGLAITGLFSSFLSFVIAFIVALAV